MDKIQILAIFITIIIGILVIYAIVFMGLWDVLNPSFTTLGCSGIIKL